jgi:uncharacterized protein (TIGR03437 family)
MRPALAAFLMLMPASGATGRLFPLPLAFEPNSGESSARFPYLARSGRYTVLLSAGETAFKSGPQLVALRLHNARADARLEPVDPLPGRSNYYIGRDPALWRKNVPQYARLRARDVWPGIDLVYYGGKGGLEFDFIVGPGTDPTQVELASGERLRIGKAGELLLGDYGRLHAPVIYQVRDGQRRPIAGRYVRRAGRIGFEVASYDRRLPLVIDPVLTYSTYLGGTSTDGATGVAMDSAGNAYITGSTASTDFPVLPGPARTSNTAGNFDIFVTKLSPNGTTVLFSTYIGGQFSEVGIGIAVDSGGNVYVGGTTNSTDFPVTASAYQRAYRGGLSNNADQAGDAFALKLNSTGGLVWATLLGGALQDRCFDLAIDASNNVYVAGYTASVDFPRATAGNGAGDAFVAKLNETGSELIFSTLLGGGGLDAANAIVVDQSNAVYVTGTTASSNFPTTPGVFQPLYGGGASDAFVVKLGSTGGIVFSSYLGGNGAESGQSLAQSRFGETYIAGVTSSDRFPVTPGAAQSTYGGGSADGFIAGVHATGSSLTYATYAGGERVEDQGSIAIDASDAIYVAFATESLTIRTTLGGFQTRVGGSRDVWIAALSPSGGEFTYASYLGGGGSDQPQAIAVDTFGNVVVVGTTQSGDFPVRRPALRNFYAGGTSDAFVTKFAFNVPSMISSPAELQPFSYEIGQGTPAPQRIMLRSSGVAFPFTVSVSSAGTWLSVTPPSGTTPATLVITANPSGLTPRTYTGTINIASPVTGVTLTLIATLVVAGSGAPVSISSTGIVSGATGLGGPIVPGQIVSIYGVRIGAPNVVDLQVDSSGFVTTTLAGNRVFFDDTPAPIIGAAPDQLNVVVPYSTAGRTAAQVQVEANGVRSNSVFVPVATVAPGIFSTTGNGHGQAIAQNEDGSPNSVAKPAKRGSVIVFLATGEGQTDPPGIDGKPATEVFPAPRLPVRVWVGGVEAEILYAGAAPNFVAGVMQVNVRVPANTRSGEMPLMIRVGNATSPDIISVAIE